MTRLKFILTTALVLTALLAGLTCGSPTSDPSPFDALILTPMIDAGNYKQARNQARVNHPAFNSTISYSGFLTVNESCGNNLFFWFFPAETNYENAPVFLWLNGGPGLSSLVGAMTENGPVRIVNDDTVEKPEYYWTKNYSIVYIDSPAGVGFSFTEKGCYASELGSIGEGLYNGMVQFFQLFPELVENEFYATGESYAGKYLPTLCYKIDQYNNDPYREPAVRINLKGLIIGNALSDPLSQHGYSEYLYELGFVDDSGRKQLGALEHDLTVAIMSKQWELASRYYEDLILGGNQSLYYNLTGLTLMYNYITGDHEHRDKITKFLTKADVREALHVGQTVYNCSSDMIFNSMKIDRGKSVMPLLTQLLTKYRIMYYNGQLDVGVAYTLSRKMLNALPFRGKMEFENADRIPWFVDGEVVAYLRSGGNLTFAMVRNAGHMAPKDQPKIMWNVLKWFMDQSS